MELLVLCPFLIIKIYGPPLVISYNEVLSTNGDRKNDGKDYENMPISH